MISPFKYLCKYFIIRIFYKHPFCFYRRGANINEGENKTIIYLNDEI